MIPICPSCNIHYLFLQCPKGQPHRQTQSVGRGCFWGTPRIRSFVSSIDVVHFGCALSDNIKNYMIRYVRVIYANIPYLASLAFSSQRGSGFPRFLDASVYSRSPYLNTQSHHSSPQIEWINERRTGERIQSRFRNILFSVQHERWNSLLPDGPV